MSMESPHKTQGPLYVCVCVRERERVLGLAGLIRLFNCCLFTL